MGKNKRLSPTSSAPVSVTSDVTQPGWDAAESGSQEVSNMGCTCFLTVLEAGSGRRGEITPRKPRHLTEGALFTDLGEPEAFPPSQ